MVNIHPEYIFDENQNRKSILLPLSEWEQILEALEELDDIRAYDELQQHTTDRLPFEQAVREIQKDYPA
jgi:hypothetical protein